MSNIFETIFDAIEIATTDVITGGEAIAPVVAAIPGAAPVLAAVEGGASAVAATIAAGRAIVSAASPEVVSLWGILESLLHITPTPSALVLTPKTSVATVSATPATMVAATQAAS